MLHSVLCLQMLVIGASMGGQLVASDMYPSNTKTKTCYFIKKEPGAIPLVKDDTSFKRNLIYGDLSHQPLENLVCYVENV